MNSVRTLDLETSSERTMGKFGENFHDTLTTIFIENINKFKQNFLARSVHKELYFVLREQNSAERTELFSMNLQYAYSMGYDSL